MGVFVLLAVPSHLPLKKGAIVLIVLTMMEMERSMPLILVIVRSTLVFLS